MSNTYIKSPLNYVGGKYKLLKYIMPLFPENIHTFVDLFCGGCNVGINTTADRIICNDIMSSVIGMLQYFKDNSTEDNLQEIDNLIAKYSLTKENQQGFLDFRNDYNENPTPIKLYTLICYAFNYQIRFNNQGKYNMPFGKNRSSFNEALREKFIIFNNALTEKNIVFTNKSFTELKFDKLGSTDFIYCDPPYFNSTATYNENGGWGKTEEKQLLNLLDQVNTKGIKFALSNNLKYDNPFLDKWKDKYIVHYLKADYSNCNYHKKDKSEDIEVLITNY